MRGDGRRGVPTALDDVGALLGGRALVPAKDLETFEGVLGNCQHSGERFRRDNETFNESQGKCFFLIFLVTKATIVPLI